MNFETKLKPVLNALLSLLLICGVLSGSAFAQSRQDRRPKKGLQPIVCASLSEALKRSAAREQPSAIAVGMADNGEYPEIFSDPTIARCSRATVSLASVEYFSQDPFFRSHNISRDQVPCVLILDTHGNPLQILPGDVEAKIIVASIRNTRTLMRNIEIELKKALPQAEELAKANDEASLLKFLRPWIKKHLQGYPEAEKFRELLHPFGQAHLDKLAVLDDPAAALEQYAVLAEEYAHSRTQAAALYEVACLTDEHLQDRKTSKEKLRALIDLHPWPENEAIHQKAKNLLRKFRIEEIKRRQEEEQRKQEEERRKKEEEEKQKQEEQKEELEKKDS